MIPHDPAFCFIGRLLDPARLGVTDTPAGARLHPSQINVNAGQYQSPYTLPLILTGPRSPTAWKNRRLPIGVSKAASRRLRAARTTGLPRPPMPAPMPIRHMVRCRATIRPAARPPALSAIATTPGARSGCWRWRPPWWAMAGAST